MPMFSKEKWLTESSIALAVVSEISDVLCDKNGCHTVTQKDTFRDIVTNYDITSQTIALSALSASPYPVLSEELHRETDIIISSNETYWILDPIDGSVNFLYGLPLFTVSLGLYHQGDFCVGAVAIPSLKELYFTYCDQAACLNGKSVICSRDAAFNISLISCAFSSNSHSKNRDKEYALFGKINDTSMGCLRLGSAAVSICFVVSQRLSAAYGLGVKIWDTAPIRRPLVNR